VAVCPEISIGSRWPEVSDIKVAIESDRAFVKWRPTFDLRRARREELTETPRRWFGKGLESLRGTLGSRPSGFPEAATGEVGDRSRAVSG
jgi:hypothetical protein